MRDVVQIRTAVEADIEVIHAIANALISSTSGTWTEVVEPLEWRQSWFESRARDGYPILVAESEDGEVVGFASYGDFRDSVKWPGYRFTVENSVHVRESFHRQGIARLLMEALMAEAVAGGKQVMVAAIDSENEDSIRFHAQLGFEEVGRLSDIGFKFGRWLTLVVMQRRLSEVT
ncbi:MAG TPA: GNAT family N-acetyltransferase [Acidimicrobiales bacterium]